MTDEAHYQRIASEIRSRIQSGRLQPGERAPSTRAIVRDWGVAMATATKALAVLKAEGAIHTRSGYGSIVSAQGSAISDTPKGLSLDRILQAAISVADTEGLSAVTMRRMAVEMSVATMALYRHVDSKESLLETMTDRVLREQPIDCRDSGWRPRLDSAARSVWTAFRLHPWAAETVSLTRPQLLPSLLTYAEFSLSTFRALGLDVNTAMHGHLTLFAYVRSAAASLETEAQARRDTGMTNEEWMESGGGSSISSVVSTGGFPAFEWVVHSGYDYDVDALFEFGLDRLLDGFEVAFGKQPRLGQSI